MSPASHDGVRKPRATTRGQIKRRLETTKALIEKFSYRDTAKGLLTTSRETKSKINILDLPDEILLHIVHHVVPRRDLRGRPTSLTNYEDWSQFEKERYEFKREIRNGERWQLWDLPGLVKQRFSIKFNLTCQRFYLASIDVIYKQSLITFDRINDLYRFSQVASDICRRAVRSIAVAMLWDASRHRLIDTAHRDVPDAVFNRDCLADFPSLQSLVIVTAIRKKSSEEYQHKIEPEMETRLRTAWESKSDVIRVIA